MKAWNSWYHVNGNTYGTWLRGDARGWRTRWHREHVEGDYRNPPGCGTFEDVLAQSQESMKHPPVRLDVRRRRIAGQALAEKLVQLKIELLVLSLDAVHYHALARFPDHKPRWWIGLAKKHASHVLRKYGLAGAVWARKSHPLPITDRTHQLNVFGYIRDHADVGAWVWTFRDGLYWLDAPDHPDAHESDAHE